MKNTIIILIFFAVGASLMWVAFSSNTIQEWKIKREITKASYCKRDSDCRIVISRCPFNCYVYVNKNEAARIGKLIESYESYCAYVCVQAKEAVCANNICQQECFGSQCKDQNSWWKRKIKLFAP